MTAHIWTSARISYPANEAAPAYIRTAAMMPQPMQKATGKLGMIAIFPRGLVTLSTTNIRLKVKIASIHIP